MKIREMTPEQRKGYMAQYMRKYKEWKKRNPEKVKAERKRYKQSEKGKSANQKYWLKRYSSQTIKEAISNYNHERYLLHPERYKHRKGYMAQYMRKYILNEENHRKFLIRQKDRYKARQLLAKIKGFCQLCGSTDNLELHHKEYDESSNVMLLCRKCHRQLHRKPINKFEKQEVN